MKINALIGFAQTANAAYAINPRDLTNPSGKNVPVADANYTDNADKFAGDNPTPRHLFLRSNR